VTFNVNDYDDDILTKYINTIIIEQVELYILYYVCMQRYEVMFSMLEIYNEQVRDLLSKDHPKGGLPIRQDPGAGSFYVQGLKQVPVGSFLEISKRMEQG